MSCICDGLFMTARHALTELEREGAVVRRRGAGTFVAPPKIHFNKLMQSICNHLTWTATAFRVLWLPSMLCKYLRLRFQVVSSPT